jgi:hypothetical protein
MRLRHLYAVIATAVVSLLLSGCYVTSLVPPAKNGAPDDARLVGTWYGLDEHGKHVADAFLHFIKPKDGGPMLMLATGTDEYTVYELHTVQLGANRFFAVRKLHTRDLDAGKAPDKESKEFTLGAYDVRRDKLVMRLFDTDKIRAAVTAKRVKGEVEKGDFGGVTLTGTPEELSRFLASAEANGALEETRVLARRLPRPR